MFSQTPRFIPPQAQWTRDSHVAIVLDRSGSMESCRNATISGFNAFKREVIDATCEFELRTRMTLTVFNDEVRMPLFQAPLERLHSMSRKYYVPNGSTAMLDGVGGTIDRLERHGRGIDGANVLVCIISDGYENASRTYSYDAVAERIARLTATERWTFTYLGSNQDVSEVSDRLAIPMGNVTEYEATEEGTADAWDRHTSATRRRMQDTADGTRSSRDFYVNK